MYKHVQKNHRTKERLSITGNINGNRFFGNFQCLVKYILISMYWGMKSSIYVYDERVQGSIDFIASFY